MTAEQRLLELQLELPPAPKALGLYCPAIQAVGLVHLSGHGPLQPDGSFMTGRLGDDMVFEQGYQAARRAGLAVLATLRAELRSLDRVARLVKTFGLVQATPDFADHPAVINGFSELMRDVFGEAAGVGARSAVGAASLPGRWAVEIEATFELKP